jgi:hypothetical protein
MVEQKKITHSIKEWSAAQGILGADLGLITQNTCCNTVPEENLREDFRNCALYIKLGIWVWHELA